ncbi:hypothetical protein LA080_012987 [Diaporthe eres]|nr:hypothetical protein LA080_012987 [Diaporthe eres]
MNDNKRCVLMMQKPLASGCFFCQTSIVSEVPPIVGVSRRFQYCMTENPVDSLLKRQSAGLSIEGTAQTMSSGVQSQGLHGKPYAMSLRHNPVTFVSITKTPLEWFQVEGFEMGFEVLERLIHSRSVGSTNSPAATHIVSGLFSVHDADVFPEGLQVV